MKSFKFFVSLILLLFVFHQTIFAQENAGVEINDLIIVEDSTTVKGSIFPLLRKKRNTSIKAYYLNINEDGRAQADTDIIKTNENTRGLFAEYNYVRSELITYISSLQIDLGEYNGKREINSVTDRKVFNISGKASDISLTAGIKIEIDATSVFRQSNLEFRLLYFLLNGSNRDYIPLETDLLASSTTSGTGTGYFVKYQRFYTPRLDFIFFTQNSNILLNNKVTAKSGDQGSSKEEVAILQLGGGIEYYFNLGGFRNDSIEALLDIKTLSSEETEFEHDDRFGFSQKKSIKDTLVTLSLQYQHSFNPDLDIILYFGSTSIVSDNKQPPPEIYNRSLINIPEARRPQPETDSNFTLNSEVNTVRIGAEYYFD